MLRRAMRKKLMALAENRIEHQAEPLQMTNDQIPMTNRKALVLGCWSLVLGHWSFNHRCLHAGGNKIDLFQPIDAVELSHDVERVGDDDQRDAFFAARLADQIDNFLLV